MVNNYEWADVLNLKLRILSIKFVPRHMFVNNCSQSIIFAQDEKETFQQYYLHPGESVSYNFEDKKKNHNSVKIRLPRSTEKDVHTLILFEDIQVLNWSSKFSIND